MRLRLGRFSGLRFIVTLFCVCLGCGTTATLAQLDSDTPTPVGPFLNGAFPTMSPIGAVGTWDVVPAFPNLPLRQTLAIDANPSNGELWVGSLRGKIEAFEPDPATSQIRTILNLEDRTSQEGGLIGIAFHPEFGTPNSPNRNFFYAYYASICALNNQLTRVDLTRCTALPAPGNRNGFYGAYLRLSRFEYFDGATPLQVRNSETPMINIRLFNDSHRGGGPIFGSDGYLYLAIGEQQLPYTAQDMRTNLHGGLRLAVDVTENGNGDWSCPAGSHKPRRTFQDNFNNTQNQNRPGHDDELSGHYYCIPNSNPWQDPSANSNFEEYFSTGHRNPHRITMDSLTGQIWSGEVGSNQSEEVNIIEIGKNYGWPCREGYVNKPAYINEPYCQASQTGTLTDPIIDFDRSEANALIGGYVYRGSKFPELYGKYLAGDWVLGHIYAVSYDRATGAASKMRLTTWDANTIGTWGQDLDGEIYLGHVDKVRPLHTLDKIIDSTPEPPATLFETGAFMELSSLEPASYWLPYELNQPFWSDGAVKSRWIAVPAGEKITFSESNNWDFPVGTVIMKHFELPVDETNPGVTTRLETRFMVHGEDEWYGVTYRWNSAQTDAVLLTDGQSADYQITTPGGTRTQTWDFPSRTDCLFCHNSSVAGVAGVRTHTLNGQYTYPKSGIVRNQLRAWNQLGLFTPALDPNDIPGYLRSVHVSDTSAPIADRARSWLDINCSNCHRPGGPGDRANFDTRLTTPLVSQNLIYGPVLESLGLNRESLITPKCVSCSVIYQRVAAVNEIAMPPLAKHLIDNEGVTTLAQWINSLDDDIPNGDSCGFPNYTASGDRAIFLWQDCAGNRSWHFRASGGNGPLVTAMGNLVTDQAFNNVTAFKLESNDVLNVSAGRIDFLMKSGRGGQDGLNFFVDAGNTCLTLDESSGLDVLVGANRIAVSSPFNIHTLASCGSGGQPSLSITDIQVSEGAGMATLNVKLSSSSTSTVTVDFQTSNGSAIAGEDFVTATGTLTFNPGITSLNLSVPLIQDTLAEGTETFNINLSGATNATISDATGTVSIQDDDIPCGAPDYTASGDRAIFLWQDCDANGNGRWHIRVTGGNGPLVSAIGNLVTDQSFNNVTAYRLESNDVLNAGNSRIDFTMYAGSRGQDGFSFNVAPGNTCLTLDESSGLNVMVGPNRMAASSPFDIKTLGACN